MKKVIVQYIRERYEFYKQDLERYKEELINLLEIIKQYANKHNKVELVKSISYYQSIVPKSNGIIEDSKIDEIDKEIIQFLKDIKESKLRQRYEHLKSIVKNLRYKVLGEAIGTLLAKYRTELVKDIFEYNANIICDLINKSTKTVIFTYLKEPVNDMKKIIESKCNVKVLVLTGETKDRENVIKKFKQDESIKVLIATYQIASVGLTLTEANTMIYADKPYREADLLQAKDRIYRIGQSNEVYIYYLKLGAKEPTFQDRVDYILKYYKQIVDEIVSGANK